MKEEGDRKSAGVGSTKALKKYHMGKGEGFRCKRDGKHKHIVKNLAAKEELLTLLRHGKMCRSASSRHLIDRGRFFETLFTLPARCEDVAYFK